MTNSDESNDIIEEEINGSYNHILKQIDGSSLFGKFVDIDNPKEVAVAFYYFAIFQEHKRDLSINDIYKDFTRR